MLNQEIIGRYDDQLLEDALKIYLEDGKATMEKLVNQFHENNSTEVKFWAHKLKGSSAMIGATSVADLSSFIEEKAKNNDLSFELELKQLQNDFVVLCQHISFTYKI